MAGHSHWHKIRWQKGIADAKKSKLFSKLAREITVAVREGGKDPEFNPRLRMVIEKAKRVNMPSENIERAIKRGTGEIEGGRLESFVFEAYGPEGVALMIEGITDNKKRSLNEIRQILSQYGGKLIEEGGVRWMFDRKGWIEIDYNKLKDRFKKEQLELLCIDGGAEDLKWKSDDKLEIYTKPEELESVKNFLKEKGVEISDSSLDWVPKETKEVEDKGKLEKLFEALDEQDDVQEIYSNLKEEII